MAQDRKPQEASPRPPVAEIPAMVYGIAVGFIVWLLAIAILAFGGGSYAPVVFGACIFLTVIAFGAPALISAMSGSGYSHGSGFRRWMRERTDIQTGSLRGRDAMVEILLIPATLSIGFTAIAIVELVIG